MVRWDYFYRSFPVIFMKLDWCGHVHEGFKIRFGLPYSKHTIHVFLVICKTHVQCPETHLRSFLAVFRRASSLIADSSQHRRLRRLFLVVVDGTDCARRCWLVAGRSVGGAKPDSCPYRPIGESFAAFVQMRCCVLSLLCSFINSVDQVALDIASLRRRDVDDSYIDNMVLMSFSNRLIKVVIYLLKVIMQDPYHGILTVLCHISSVTWSWRPGRRERIFQNFW